MFIPLILIVLGLFFFAKAIGVLTVDALSLSVLWPLILVVAGLVMVSHNMFGHSCKGKACEWCKEVKLNGKSKR